MSETIAVRPAMKADAEWLATRLRSQDRDEIYAVTGSGPLPVLREGVAASRPCFAVTGSDGELLALFGVLPRERGRGKVWLLGTSGLLLRRFSVARSSRKWIDVLHRDYPTLWNYVDARNEAHIRWLKWCGFHFAGTVEDFGFERRRFYFVEKTAG